MSKILKSYQVASYMRLSREDGDKVLSDSIANQKAMIADYIKDHDGLILTEEFVDDGYSGTTFDRPAFARMMAAIKAKKINCVIVKDLSRLGRNYIETGRYLENIFPMYGVRFISILDRYDNVDETGDVDQIIVPFKNLINDAYCRDISMKIKSHFEVKRKSGQFIGSFASYGYANEIENQIAEVVGVKYAVALIDFMEKLESDYKSTEEEFDRQSGLWESAANMNAIAKKFVGEQKLSRQMAEAFIENVYIYDPNRIEIVFQHEDEIAKLIESLN